MPRKTGPKPGRRPLKPTKAEQPSGAAGFEALTRADAARRLGISETWLYVLERRGSISRNPDRSYPWPTIREDYERYKAAGRGGHGNSEGGSGGDALRDEQIRLTREKADKAAMENELLRGTLVKVEESLDNLDAVLLAMDATLRSAKRRRGPALARRLGIAPGEAMDIVEEITEEVRAGLLDAIERLAVERADATEEAA
jgi:phage terminase Nu1 subunit (DNA packaging protein)